MVYSSDVLQLFTFDICTFCAARSYPFILLLSPALLLCSCASESPTLFVTTQSSGLRRLSPTSRVSEVVFARPQAFFLSSAASGSGSAVDITSTMLYWSTFGAMYGEPDGIFSAPATQNNGSVEALVTCRYTEYPSVSRSAMDEHVSAPA